MKSIFEKNSYKNKCTELVEKTDGDIVLSIYKYKENNINFCKINLKEKIFYLKPEEVHYVLGDVKESNFLNENYDEKSIYNINNDIKNSYYFKKTIGYNISKYEGNGIIKLIDTDYNYIIAEIEEGETYIVNKKYFCGCSSNLTLDVGEIVLEEYTSKSIDTEGEEKFKEVVVNEIILSGNGIILLRLPTEKEKINEIMLKENSKLRVNSTDLPIMRSVNLVVEEAIKDDKEMLHYLLKNDGITWII